jgi:outer membrane biogenesis lipoprotein LolB
MTLRLLKLAVIASAVTLLTGCGSSVEKAQEDSYKAQESVANQRLELVDKYQECMKNAAEMAEEEGTDQGEREKACESYLKAAEALN